MGVRAKVSYHYSSSSLHVDLSSETGEIRVWHAHLRPSPLPLCKWGALYGSRQEPAQAGLLEFRELTLGPQGHQLILGSQTLVSLLRLSLSLPSDLVTLRDEDTQAPFCLPVCLFIQGDPKVSTFPGHIFTHKQGCIPMRIATVS